MPLRIALAQKNFLVGDLKGNTQIILDTLDQARDQLKADAILFPELALTGYPPEDLLLRPAFLDAVEAALQQITLRAQGIVVILGYPERSDGHLHNSAIAISDGQVLANYRKQKLPNYGVFDEKRYFKAGHSAGVFALKGHTVGLTICEDIWHPDPIEAAVKAGAELIFNLNASPFHIGKAQEREALLNRRASDHRTPIVYLNLVGGQDELVFDGGSFVTNAKGEIIQRANAFQEALLLTEWDENAGQLEPIPATSLTPPLQAEAATYEALVLGLRDYVTKNGFKGAVLGLSGGIDSALTLALAVDALGKAQVEGVLMPSRYTANMSNEDAIAEAKALGCQHAVIPIEPAFKTFLDLLSGVLKDKAFDATEENIQARCRGILLMAISNKTGRILLTTGNKSEMSVGYATLYGDMAGGFAPLKDVPKMMVYRLAAYRNRIAPVIPERVMTRPPSAELRPDQKDEDSLPPYPVLDAILEQYVEHHRSVNEIIAAGFEPEVVRRITRLVDLNEYKRRQAPPGVKITRRAFGRDRRYPLTQGFKP